MKRIKFVTMIILLLGCEAPYEKNKVSRTRVKKKKENPIPNLPWTPPLSLPEKSDNDEQIPRYLKPRPSRFSKKMWKKIQRHQDEFITIRRYLHSHPELAHREVKTARYLIRIMKELGLKKSEAIGLTGVSFVLKGSSPGPTIGILAGMDGLPVAEKTKKPFSSRSYGYWLGKKVKVSHAYGKDVEMATLIGTAKILASMKKNIKGKIVFIFQPASTKVQSGEKMGAPQVISSRVLSRLGLNILLHLPLDPNIVVGKVGVPVGAVNGGLTHFSIKIGGTRNRICSGNVPWKCIDPIAVGTHLVQELLLVPSRKFGPDHQVVLNVGKINGGESAHLMASSFSLEGTFQWLISSDRRRMMRLIRRQVRGSAKASGTNIKLDFKKGPQLNVGHKELTSWFLRTLVRSLSRKGVVPADPLADPGDFVHYHKELPTAMFLLGCSKKNKYAGKRGTGDFDPDEEVVSVGIHVITNLIMDYLHSSDPPQYTPSKSVKKKTKLETP